MEEAVLKYQLACALAAWAHRDQVDKAGRPYIEHPLAVAEAVEGEEARLTALLHDVVEDSSVTPETLRNLFGEEVADAVEALTHREGEDYFDYIRRLSRNSLARQVKLADLAHNMDLSRISAPGEADLRRVEKYRRAREMLLEP